MSIEEDECARHPHGVTSGLRIRPMPLSDDEVEEELEVQEILETPVGEQQEYESSAEKGEVETSEEGDEADSSEEDKGERFAVDDASRAVSVRRLCAAMLEAASELVSKTTLSSALLADASEAEDTSTEATEEPAVEVDEPAGEVYDPQSLSSRPEIDNDLTIAMAELKGSTAFFDAAMQRLRDAERAATHPTSSSRVTPSATSTTRSDFEDTLGDAAEAAASAADLASLAIRRRA